MDPNIRVTLRHLPEMIDVEEALINVLTQPNRFHALAPAMKRNPGIPVTSGLVMLKDFDTYMKCTSDEGRRLHLEHQIFNLIIPPHERSAMMTAPVRTTNLPLHMFLSKMVDEDVAFLVLGADRWTEFVNDIECRRLVVSQAVKPYVCHIIGNMQVIPASQSPIRPARPVVPDSCAMTLDSHILYNYDYQSVGEIVIRGADPEFLIAYDLGIHNPGRDLYKFTV